MNVWSLEATIKLCCLRCRWQNWIFWKCPFDVNCILRWYKKKMSEWKLNFGKGQILDLIVDMIQTSYRFFQFTIIMCVFESMKSNVTLYLIEKIYNAYFNFHMAKEKVSKNNEMNFLSKWNNKNESRTYWNVKKKFWLDDSLVLLYKKT